MICIDTNNYCSTLDPSTVDQLHKQSKQSVSWPVYLFYTSLLITLSPFVIVAKTHLLVSNFFKRKDKDYAQIQDRIQKYASLKHHNYSTEDLMDLTQRIHALVEPKMKSIILDLVAMEKDLSHIHPILRGANVEIKGDDGFFFQQWKTASGAKKRHSSHRCDRDLAYSIRGSLFNEFLFWKDRNSHDTRFQLEANSIHNPIINFPSLILHLNDFLNYKRSGLQQSQFGQSPFTEDQPIRINFNKKAFSYNKTEIKKIIDKMNQTIS